MMTNFTALLLLTFLYLCIVALITLGVVSFKDDISFVLDYIISFIVLTVGLLFILFISYLMASNGILL